MELAIATREDGEAAIVALSGELDIGSSDLLRDHLAKLLAGGRCRIVMDLTQLAFCDSTGLSTFVKASHG